MKKQKITIKKLTVTSLVALIMIGFTNSNAQAFEEGSSYVNLGYGFGTLSKAMYSIYEVEEGFKYTETGPIYLKYEYAVSDKIGIGINMAYKSGLAKYSYSDNAIDTYTQSIKNNGLSVFARFNYHFGDHDNFDPYIGLGLGYRNNTIKYSSTDPNWNEDDFSSLTVPIPFGGDFTLGARYLFTDNIGAYAELGLAKSVFQVGLTAKF